MATSASTRSKKSKKKANKATTEKARNDSSTQAAAPQEEQASTLWDTFIGHWSLPFYGITLAVLLPYFLHNAYLHLLLERPDVLTQFSAGVLQVRPAVALTDVRPVLIVGTIKQDNFTILT